MGRVSITNFSKGEFGPQLYGRIDVPQYSAGARKLHNFQIQRYGGATFRPGFRFVGEADTVDQPERFIAFQFSLEQAYVLSFGQAQMRPLALGGFILEEDLKIHGATQTNPMVLHVPFHGFEVGDRFYLSGNSGMTEINGMFVKALAVPDADHVTVNVNGATFSPLTASTGITRTVAPTPPAPPPAPPAPPPAPPPPDTGGGGGSGGNIDPRYDDGEFA